MHSKIISILSTFKSFCINTGFLIIYFIPDTISPSIDFTEVTHLLAFLTPRNQEDGSIDV